MKTLAIIQARMKSSRLRNKMMLSLHGYPICEWVYKRLMKSKNIDSIVFALPNSAHDDVLENHLKSIGARVFRGSESDVVDRYYKIANELKFDNIVRVCADNPLVCSSEIDRLIDFFVSAECDYAYNHIPIKNNYPNGFGAEICSMQILRNIYENSSKKNHREHLFNYLWDNEKDYKMMTFNPPDNIAFPDLKFDIDTKKDYEYLSSKNFKIDMSAEEIINLTISES